MHLISLVEAVAESGTDRLEVFVFRVDPGEKGDPHQLLQLGVAAPDSAFEQPDGLVDGDALGPSVLAPDFK